MGELWRSQEMQLVQLYLQIDAAHDTIDELAKLGAIQFRDLNPHVNPFQRNFVNEIKRMDELQRILMLFDAAIEEYNASLKVKALDRKLMVKIKPAPSDSIHKREHIDELESKFEELEKSLTEMTRHAGTLESSYVKLIELKHVLQKDESFFGHGDGDAESASSLVGEKPDVEGGIGLDQETQLKFLSGVINRSDFHLFETVLWRAMKGSLIMNYAEIEEDILDTSDVSGSPAYVKKNAFIIFFPGKQLETKIRKLCDALNAHVYQTPSSSVERKKLLKQVKERLEESETLKRSGEKEKRELLVKIAAHLEHWKNVIRREKAIYHTMNMFNFDHGRKCLIAEGWCPTTSVESVQIALRTGRERASALVPSILNVIPYGKDEPPTYFKTNKFTRAFQSIVDSYGVARYQEINPAVLTIVTFPFEFACMFGDMGHGFLLMLYALLMIKMEKQWEGKKINEMMEMTYYGRYLLLLMSLFSIYQGALYNEMFSLPVDFGTNWRLQYGPGWPNSTFVQIHRNWAYPFGVDPVWKGASNELLYYNSLKMKMSIIIGVIQMTVGLFLHLLNGIYFRKPLDIFFEFLPRFTFLSSIFGYLCFMIIYKWNVDYIGQDAFNRENNINGSDAVESLTGTSTAPVVLNELIFMFLPGGPGDRLYKGQTTVQTILVILAFISIPLMMLPKPLIMRYQHNKAHPKVKKTTNEEEGDEINLESVSSEGSDDEDNPKKKSEKKLKAPSGGHGHGEEFEFGEIMVHQILETIEFVLGSVSHTASYLRLWALSLAHSELATVFWNKILFQLYSYGWTNGLGVTAILAFCAFSAWFFATAIVIMFMESLSAFLHALRLHWVEFQSKFYKGDGYAFLPLSYHRLLTTPEEEF